MIHGSWVLVRHHLSCETLKATCLRRATAFKIGTMWGRSLITSPQWWTGGVASFHTSSKMWIKLALQQCRHQADWNRKRLKASGFRNICWKRGARHCGLYSKCYWKCSPIQVQGSNRKIHRSCNKIWILYMNEEAFVMFLEHFICHTNCC